MDDRTGRGEQNRKMKMDEGTNEGTRMPKAVIMAAGKGTRMLPLTKEVPKPLVEVAGKPFLSYLLMNIVSAGYRDIGIVAGYKIEKIERFIDEIRKPSSIFFRLFPDVFHDVSFTVLPQKEQRGTADAILSAKDFVGHDDFVALGGDNLWSPADLAAAGLKDDLNYIGGMVVDDPGRFGVLISDMSNEYLVEIKEKPRHFVGNLINTGLYRFKQEIFDALSDVSMSERKELELTDAITSLASRRRVKILKVNDYWIDFGSVGDIPKVEGFVKKVFSDTLNDS